MGGVTSLRAGRNTTDRSQAQRDVHPASDHQWEGMGGTMSDYCFSLSFFFTHSGIFEVVTVNIVATGDVTKSAPLRRNRPEYLHRQWGGNRCETTHVSKTPEYPFREA